MRIDLLWSRRSCLFYYGLLTLLFLGTGAFASTVFDYYLRAYRVGFLFLLLFLPLTAYLVFYRRKENVLSLPLFLTTLYFSLIMGIGIVHGVALFNAPAQLELNVIGVTAAHFVRSNLGFSLIYLLFPIMLVGQFVLLKRIGFRPAIRCFALAAMFSGLVLLYQLLWDHNFLNALRWVEWPLSLRYSGLAEDPNSFALAVFMTVGVLVLGINYERSVVGKLCYGALIIFLVSTSWFAGNRTVAGGFFLLIALVPVILAFAASHWPLRKRLALVCLTIAIVFGFSTWLPGLFHRAPPSNVLAKRLAKTIDKYVEGGVPGVFTKKEQRGKLYGVAWSLVKRAPFTGWGAGGFYREYSNVIFQKTGKKHKYFDSPTNHYLMIAVDFGIPALILNLLLILFPLGVAVRFIPATTDFKQRATLTTVVVINLIFLLLINTIPPSYFFGVMWIWTFLLAALLVISADEYVPQVRLGWSHLFLAIFLLGMFLWVAGTFVSGEYGYFVRGEQGWWTQPYDESSLLNSK